VTCMCVSSMCAVREADGGQAKDIDCCVLSVLWSKSQAIVRFRKAVKKKQVHDKVREERNIARLKKAKKGKRVRKKRNEKIR